MAAIKQIDANAAKRLAPSIEKSLTIERVTAVGPLLDACYEFFAGVFEADVLDPKDTYEGSLARAEDEGSLPIFLAALIDLPGERWVAGFLSSDMMPVIGEPATAILAVGNIATSQQLLDAGVKGIGSRLLQAAVDAAGAKAAARGLQLRYALAEAEERSWGFWQNRGYRWPSKVNYLQPPLEFHDNGRPKHVEVDEKLMLSPLGRNESSIDGQLVRKIVQTVYENWCLKPYRGELSPKAMVVAEHYVMHTVFDRVAATISTDGPIDLVTVM